MRKWIHPMRTKVQTQPLCRYGQKNTMKVMMMMNLQRAQSENGADGYLCSARECDIPQEDDGQHGEDEVCECRQSAMGVR